MRVLIGKLKVFSIPSPCLKRMLKFFLRKKHFFLETQAGLVASWSSVQVVLGHWASFSPCLINSNFNLISSPLTLQVSAQRPFGRSETNGFSCVKILVVARETVKTECEQLGDDRLSMEPVVTECEQLWDDRLSMGSDLLRWRLESQSP